MSLEDLLDSIEISNRQTECPECGCPTYFSLIYANGIKQIMYLPGHNKDWRYVLRQCSHCQKIYCPQKENENGSLST